MCLPFWQVISRLMSETSSGSFCANDSILQSLMVALPFGGVGKSVAAECKLYQTRVVEKYNLQYINYPNTFFDRCQWNGFLPWSLQLWHLLSQEIMPAKKHTVWVCNLSALSTLWGPQSVSNDMGQHRVPEEPGLVPDPVTVWESDNRAILEECPLSPE